ncbi:MinD/ParA family ATP-binding protein [Gordonia effusa]|uniref:MinD/ParA family ATP-binding protein n=1 Tax=Gordonia effusa TaxID=263908 RepID=UPI00402BE1EA
MEAPAPAPAPESALASEPPPPAQHAVTPPSPAPPVSPPPVVPSPPVAPPSPAAAPPAQDVLTGSDQPAPVAAQHFTPPSFYGQHASREGIAEDPSPGENANATDSSFQPPQHFQPQSAPAPNSSPPNFQPPNFQPPNFQPPPQYQVPQQQPPVQPYPQQYDPTSGVPHGAAVANPGYAPQQQQPVHQQPPIEQGQPVPQQHYQPNQPPVGNLAPPPGLDQIRLIHRSKKAPQSGWRRAVHSATAGVVNLGDSAQQQHIDQLIERVRQPIRGDFRLAVLSLKGGVGKTTTTIGLGSTFASLRGDRVIAVDANPDLGTLASRVPQQTASNVRGLLNDPNVARYSDVRAHTSQAESRLEVLASERDPAISEAFSEDDYRRVVGILRNHYNIVLTDCGTGLMHSAMKGVLGLAHGIVLVTSPAIDGAQSASATLDWLNHHGYERLVSQSVVVISSSTPGSPPVDIDMMAQHFLGRTRAVQVIPYDSHLAEGAQVDLELVGRDTRTALIELAATIADSFPVTVGMPPNGVPNQWRG